ncbi:MAG: transporter, partial [Marinovum sp.]|nr:transporter [Marinovum sp.]
MLNTTKKSAAISLFVAAISCSLGLPLKAETLRQAMSAAYNNSGLLDQNRALLRAADEDVAQAAAALRPVANWSASVRDQRGWTQSASTGNTRLFNNSPSANLAISAELTLFDGGQNKTALAAAKEAVLATRQSLISVEQQILFAAVDAYMKLRRELETVGLRENNLLVIQEELRAAQDRFDVGEITKTDVAVAEARLAASTSALAAARGSYIQAQEAYQQAIGAPAGELAEPTSTPKLPDTVEAVK